MVGGYSQQKLCLTVDVSRRIRSVLDSVVHFLCCPSRGRAGENGDNLSECG